MTPLARNIAPSPSHAGLHAGGADAADLIFVSLEPWDEIWRRNQFFCAELARRRPFRRILFVGPPVDMSAAVRRRRVDEMRSCATCALPDHTRVTVTRPTKWLPNRAALGWRFNEAWMRRHVRREAKRLGFYDDGRRPLLWLNPYHADHMIGRMHEAAVIYDITDDWSQFGRNRRVQRRIAEQDRRVCEKADAVIVCSEGLAASKCQYGAKLHLIKNGVDCRHYAAVCDVHGELPDEARAWDKPVLGYTGTIHRDRLDVALVEQIARRLDRGTIVLIGPSHLNPQERRALKATGRVVITGAVPYAQLPEHMRAFDVCIVPHRVTPFTDSLNPIKLWEYLAAGKPIVSTPVAGFRDYPQHVRLATDAASFVAQAFDALSEEDDRAAARRAEAERHAWTRRVDQVEGVLDAAASRSATTRSR